MKTKHVCDFKKSFREGILNIYDKIFKTLSF